MKANSLLLTPHSYTKIPVPVNIDVFSAHERQQVRLLYSSAVTPVLARKQDPPFALSPTTLLIQRGRLMKYYIHRTRWQ